MLRFLKLEIGSCAQCPYSYEVVVAGYPTSKYRCKQRGGELLTIFPKLPKACPLPKSLECQGDWLEPLHNFLST